MLWRKQNTVKSKFQQEATTTLSWSKVIGRNWFAVNWKIRGTNCTSSLAAITTSTFLMFISAEQQRELINVGVMWDGLHEEAVKWRQENVFLSYLRSGSRHKGTLSVCECGCGDASVFINGRHSVWEAFWCAGPRAAPRSEPGALTSWDWAAGARKLSFQLPAVVQSFSSRKVSQSRGEPPAEQKTVVSSLEVMYSH